MSHTDQSECSGSRGIPSTDNNGRAWCPKCDRDFASNAAGTVRPHKAAPEEPLVIYASISSGSSEYSAEAARIPIDDFIQALQSAKEDGATYVIGTSGNYRGAPFVRLGEPAFDPNPEENQYR